jgi:hypothetical protein
MSEPRARSISLMPTLVPLLAVLCVLLGDPTGEPRAAAGHEPPAMVVSIGVDASGAAASGDQSGLPLGAMPAPRAGRLRVREADRLGPAKLHLPPPAV